MELYVADVQVLADKQVLAEKCKLLPRERTARMYKFRNFEDQLRCVGAGLLLEYGLQQRGYTLCGNTTGKKQTHLVTGSYGKPYLADTDGVYFNLSHSGIYVAAAFAECEIGIDVERVRTAKLAVARRYFDKEEYAYLESLYLECGNGDILDRAFYKLWTRKESYIKAVGEGMHLPLADFCVLSDKVEGKTQYQLKTWDLPEQYALSVCAKETITAELTQVDLMKSI